MFECEGGGARAAPVQVSGLDSSSQQQPSRHQQPDGLSLNESEGRCVETLECVAQGHSSSSEGFCLVWRKHRSCDLMATPQHVCQSNVDFH